VRTADACVIGLGGSGLAAVRALQARGATVVGLDARQVGSGAAGRNGGFLLAGCADFHHEAVERLGRARAAALYRATLAEIDRMVAESPGTIAVTGSLRIAGDAAERADCARQLAAMRADALPVETYEGPEGVGLRFPHDATTQPLARVRALARAAIAEGAALFADSPAIDVSRGRVTTASGTVQCQQVLVAIDGRLERLLPELDGTVRTARLQMCATAPATDVQLSHAVYARYGYDYWQQRPDGCLAVGGGRDLVEAEEWTTDDAPTPVVQAHLDRLLREVIGTRAPVTHRWAASVGFTRSGAPVVAEVRPGVWAVGGYCGTGNLIGAMAARAAVAAMEGDRTMAALLGDPPPDDRAPVGTPHGRLG
jgi:glycine/D-amino acid oxidase-like deaminating enzyme